MRETRIEDIRGFEGVYCISDNGKVYRIWKDGLKLKTASLDKYGYETVNLLKDGKSNRRLVHRLVAQTYVDGWTEEKYCVNHKDENKTNNHYTNLEWCTPKYNSNYGTRIERCVLNNPRRKVVRGYNDEEEKIFFSIAEATRELKVSKKTIRECINGLRESAGGYIWEIVQR